MRFGQRDGRASHGHGATVGLGRGVAAAFGVAFLVGAGTAGVAGFATGVGVLAAFVAVGVGSGVAFAAGVEVVLGVAGGPRAIPTRGLTGAPPPDQRAVADRSSPSTAKWIVAPSCGWQGDSAGIVIFQLPAALTSACPHSTPSIEAVTVAPD